MRSTRMITVEALRHDLKQVHAEQKALAREEKWLTEQIALRAGVSKEVAGTTGRRLSKSDAKKAVSEAIKAADGPVTVEDLKRRSGIGQTAIGRYLREWIDAGTVRQTEDSIGHRPRKYELVTGRSEEPTQKIKLGASGVSTTGLKAPRPVTRGGGTDLKSAREQARRATRLG